MPDTAPPWLLVMRAITGLAETSGSADNPKIMAMNEIIALAYPEMEAYCRGYTGDDIAWCGLTVAFCMTVSGVKPVFGPTDTDRWLWAKAWYTEKSFGTQLEDPRLGCVVVLTREGGGHVTLYEGTEGDHYRCRGGNQSDAVNVQSYPISDVIGLIWPLEGGELPPAERRTLEQGDVGADVEALQASLGLPVDGEFGPVTDSATRAFQAAMGLDPDGEVGSRTWAEIDKLDYRMNEGDDGLDPAVETVIIKTVRQSPLTRYSWKNRGVAPLGYLVGMALTFGLAVERWKENSALAKELAKAAGVPDADALAYYDVEFDQQDMRNDKAGLDTLRHLWVMLIGLGMCESSGKYYEGRDLSAENTSSDTCEAGLFQTSWNIKTCSTALMQELFNSYMADPNGWLNFFSKGLSPTADGLSSYGAGEGAAYQWLAKFSPAFAVFTTALGLRKRRSHWGPVGRREVEISKDADMMLRDVQALVRAGTA